jgi:hypothetical protein
LVGRVGRPETLNRYAYAVNNPVNAKDLTGLERRWIDLGRSWTGGIDSVPGTSTFEIHVYDPGGNEVGIVSGTLGWIAKHGHLAETPANVPRSVLAQINGANVAELRRRGLLGPKGTMDIRGASYLEKGRTLLGTAGNVLALAHRAAIDYEVYRRAQENDLTFAEELQVESIIMGNPRMVWTFLGYVPNPYYIDESMMA